MTFLSIAFLAALPLMATPLLLHLFHRRRSVTIDWGAMQFLTEAATRRTSARRFQHWLLLLLRVLAVAALVLALARPLIPGSWLGNIARRETILVIDNSLSTQQQSDDGTVFDSLISKAESTVNELRPGERLRILTTSPYPTWSTPASLPVDGTSRAAVLKVLAELRPTQGTGDLPAALLKAVQSELQDAPLAERRVVLLTDGQRNDWRTEDTAGWSRFRRMLSETKIPTTLEVVESKTGEAAVTNVAVGRLRTNRTVVGVHQPFTVTAEIHNYSSAPSKTFRVTWSIDEDAQPEERVPALQPGDAYDAALHHSFGRPGIYSLTCRVATDDDLQADNSGSIVIEAVEQVPVLLVEGSDDFAEIQQDAFLVRAALGRIDGEDADNWHAVFEPRTVSPQQLSTIELNDYRAVVVPNLTSLDDTVVERLRLFVEGGGGLWLALGPRTDIQRFNKLLFNEGDGLSPVALSRVVDESREDLETPTINPFSKTHLAAADADRLDTGSVRVSRRLRFQVPTEANDVSVLLELSHGEPLAVENLIGKGRVIIQAIPLRYQWSDLAISQTFVVMVHDWLGYLSEPGSTRHNLLPGEPLSMHLPRGEETQATLTTPSGQDVVVTGEPLDDGVTFRTSRTRLPGNYTLEIGLAGTSIPFHVARDPAESDLARLTSDDRAALADVSGLHRGRLTARSAGAEQRSPIWPALLIMLIALMAGELVLSGFIARKRFGLLPISDAAEQLTSRLPALNRSAVEHGKRRGEAIVSDGRHQGQRIRA